METKQLYRYYEVSYEERVTVVLEKFNVVKETDASYWYVPEHMPDKPEYRRVVRKGATRSKCYDTREAAFASFKIRKDRQVRHLRSKLRDLEWLLPQLKDWTAPVTTRHVDRESKYAEFTLCK